MTDLASTATEQEVVITGLSAIRWFRGKRAITGEVESVRARWGWVRCVDGWGMGRGEVRLGVGESGFEYGSWPATAKVRMRMDADEDEGEVDW